MKKKQKNDVKLDDLCLLVTEDTGIHRELVQHIMETYFNIVIDDVNRGGEVEFEGIGSIKLSKDYKKGEVENIKDKFYYKYSIDKLVLTSNNILIGLLNPNEDLGKTINDRVSNYIETSQIRDRDRLNKFSTFKKKYKKDCIKRTLKEICKTKK